MTQTAHTSLLRLGALALSLALLVGAELLLRAGGWLDGPPPALPADWGSGHRLAIGAADAPMLVERDGIVRTAERMVTDRFMHALAFTAQPAPGVVRIFCLGGSATLGVPIESTPARTFPGRLEHHLRSAGVPAEVINLGGASFASDQVVQLTREALPYGPSALVVYSGNNEFFSYNQRLFQDSRRWYAQRQALESLHLLRGLRRLLDRPPPPLGDPDDLRSAQDAVVEAAIRATITDDAWPEVPADGPARRTDPIAAAVAARYQANLDTVGQLAAAQGVDVLLVAVPANLFEPPWLAMHGPDADVAAWDRAMARGCDAPDDAIAADPLHAAGWHRRGLCAADAGADPAVWAPDLRSALELDLNPGRPPLALQRAPAAVAARWSHVTAMAPDISFGAHATSPYGRALFHDSCHLTATGYDRLAREIAAVLPLQSP